MQVSPVATTKKGIHSLFTKPSGPHPVMKRPASGSLYTTMLYKKTGAVAVRLRGGKQLFQILCKQEPARANPLALQAIQKLEAGMSVDQVKAWVDQEKQY